MADLFLSEDVVRVLEGKNVVFIGDSLTRGFYKDLVWLLNVNSLLPFICQKEKGEPRFPDFTKCQHLPKQVRDVFGQDNRDNRIEFKGLCSGTEYIESRHYCKPDKNLNIFFVFVTRVWTERLDDWLKSFELKNEGKKIDVVFMNSCLWDVTRWGPDGVCSFKTNLVKTLNTFKTCLHEDAHFFWLTTPVCRQELQCQALTPEGFERESKMCRINVAIANSFSAEKVAQFGFSVIDLQYYSLYQTFRRQKDGVHWTAAMNRLCSCLFLTFLCQVTNQALPGRTESNVSLENIKRMGAVARGEMTEQKNAELKLKDLAKKKEEMEPKSKDALIKLRQAMASAPKRSHPYQQQHHQQQQRPEPKIVRIGGQTRLANPGPINPWQVSNPDLPLGNGYGFNPSFDFGFNRNFRPDPTPRFPSPNFCPAPTWTNPTQRFPNPNFGHSDQFSPRTNFGPPNQFPLGPSFGPPNKFPSGPSFGPPNQFPSGPSFGPSNQFPSGPSFGPPNQFPSGPSFGPPNQFSSGPNFGPPKSNQFPSGQNFEFRSNYGPRNFRGPNPWN